jgi:predicted YcjX-like family ATPase
MKKTIRLTESDLSKLIKRIIRESDDNFTVGISRSRKTELVDDVINRLIEFGEEYESKLREFNKEFKVTKIKRIEPSRSMDDIEIPKGVKIRSTSFGY